MIYYLLPHAFPLLYKKIQLHTNDQSAEVTSLAHYLSEIKEKLKWFDMWDIYKEYTNPYEYIHTKSPNKKSVSSYQPLSRSYFKMVELIQQFHIFDTYQQQSIQTFHLAEGPGGFTESVLNWRRENAYPFFKTDEYHAISLIDERNKMVPTWRKSQSFIKSNPQFLLEYGADKTGNLLHMENFVDLVERYGSQMDFITADGGFDFSEDFSRQETSILPLLVAQIVYALCLQKYQGSFVLKIFDCFLPATVDLIYLLSSFYEKVYLTKPLTSRMANSEKYLVCQNFHYIDYHDFYPVLSNLLHQTVKQPVEYWSEKTRFLCISIPRLFLSKLEEIILILGHQQINNIYSTLALMNTKTNRNQKIDYLIRSNLSKCVFWCQKHNVPMDASFSS